MMKFNKATAAAISAGVTGVLVIMFPDYVPTITALGTLLTTLMVYLIAND